MVGRGGGTTVRQDRKLFWVWLMALALCAVEFAPAQQPQQPPPQGARPELNEPWKSADVTPLVERLESESREIYRYRRELAALVAPRPGSAVADIGAGSGFMIEEFARLVGPEGRAIAVDINPHMMARVGQRAGELGLGNISTVVNSVDSTGLPANSVDLIFRCDTYHHFEDPAAMLRAMRQALRPGGEVVLVEFTRVPGESPAWILEHVRGGKEDFIAEFTAAGFELVTVHDAPFLTENYVVRFRKAEIRN
jgi:ubiquinone/menaquinone biosynthesis C-methylase UbiE